MAVPDTALVAADLAASFLWTEIARHLNLCPIRYSPVNSTPQRTSCWETSLPLLRAGDRTISHIAENFQKRFLLLLSKITVSVGE